MEIISFSETYYVKCADMEGLKSSKLEEGSALEKLETVEVKEVVDNKDVKKAEESVADKAEEVEDKVKVVEEVVENNNCLPPAVTMDEMELLKKLEEANR